MDIVTYRLNRSRGRLSEKSVNRGIKLTAIIPATLFIAGTSINEILTLSDRLNSSPQSCAACSTAEYGEEQHPCYALQYSTVQCSAVHCSAVQCNMVLCMSV